MDFDNESLLLCFKTEAEQKEIIDWSLENGHKRSDIFEYRLEKSDELREQGNEFFKNGDFDSAQQRYMAGIYQLDFDVGQQWNLMEKHHNMLNTRKLKVLSNVCGAYLKAKDYTNAKTAADAGLRHLEKSKLEDKDAEAKFLYRKGVANLERGFSEEAYEALKKSDAINPGDKLVRQALKQAGDIQKADRQEAKQVWKNHLLSEEDKVLLGPWWQPEAFWLHCKAFCARRCARKPPKKKKSA